MSPEAPAAAGSPPGCPLSCTHPAHQHCPSSHTEPVEEQGFIPLGQLSTLYFLCYLCPLLLSPAWLARKALYVALAMATSISSLGGPSPPAHPPHLFTESPQGPAGSCPHVRMASRALSSEGTIVRGPIGSDWLQEARLGQRSEVTVQESALWRGAVGWLSGLPVLAQRCPESSLRLRQGAARLQASLTPSVPWGLGVGRADPDTSFLGSGIGDSTLQTVFYKSANVHEKQRDAVP